MSDSELSIIKLKSDGPFRNPRCDDEGNLCIVPPYNGLPTQKFLTISGDGLGNYNATGDYSTGITDFYYQVPSGNIYDLYSLIISVSDNLSFNQGDYGGIVGGLINGVKIVYYSSTFNIERVLLSGIAFKKNYEWLQITANTDLTTFAGTAQTLKIIFNIQDDYGQPFHLISGDRFIVRLNDNFTSLVGHTFGIRGIFT